jgi:hypothetical protein
MQPRVLSVKQPWASLIISGLKAVENRTWATRYRGRLYIHASSRIGGVDWDDVFGKAIDGWAGPGCGIEVQGPDGLVSLPPYGTLPVGVILGHVELVDCCPRRKLPAELRGGPFVEGPVCWALGNPVVLPRPVSCLGRLGVWTAPPGLRLR